MGKGHIDSNLVKHLAELSNHPALLRRCQEFYLERVINKLSYEELGRRKGVSMQTAWKYVQAYKRVAENHKDNPTVLDVIAFCHNEIARLLRLREGATRQEDKMLTSEVRSFQAMINEVTGLVDHKPQVNVNVLVGQVVNVVVEEVPKAFGEFIGQPLSAELVDKALALVGERIVKRCETSQN